MAHYRQELTHQRLQKILRQLILTESCERITVTRITQLAGIHRKTFYLHYRTMDDMFFELENHLFARLIELSHRHHREMGGLPGYEVMSVFIQLIESDQELNERLITTPSYEFVFRHVLERYLVMLKHYIMREHQQPEWQAEIMANFVISSILSGYRTWLEAPQETDVAQLSALISGLIRDGVVGVLG